MLTYKLQINYNNESCAVFRSDGWSIPFDSANTDYAQFKKAVLDGAELQDAEGKAMSAEQATQFVKELP